MISVILADDHQIFRRGLKLILSEYSSDILVADEAGSTDELAAHLTEKSYDILILDISMPGNTGLETLRMVREKYPRMRVIMLSMYPEEQYALRAMKAGALGYLTKETAGEQIGEAIERVHKGQYYVTPTVAELLTREVIEPQKGPAHETLSEREFEVLLLLAEGMSLKEVGEKLGINIKTVSTYRSRVLDKMQFSNNADLIKYVLKHKLKMS